MTKSKLVKRIEFARMAGVAASTVTRACKGRLAPACQGDRVDINHAAAQNYLNRRELADAEPLAPGVDPVHEAAVELCRREGRVTKALLKERLNISDSRALALAKVLKNANILDVPPAPVPEAKPPPKNEGVFRPSTSVGAREQKKRQSGQPPIEIPEDLREFADMPLAELINKFGTDVRFLDWLNATQKIEAIHEKRLKNAATEGTLVNQKLVEAGIFDVIESAFVRLLTDGKTTISSRAHAVAQSGGDVRAVATVVEDLLESFIAPAVDKMRMTLEAMRDAQK